MPFDPTNYQCTIGEHNNQDILWIHFPYKKLLIDNLKEVAKAKWSQSQKCWFIADVIAYRQLFGLPQKNYGKKVFTDIHQINQPAFLRYTEQLQLKGYSPNTIKTYCAEFAQLLKILQSFPVNELTTERLRSYFLYCIKKIKLSENQIHSRINAIKFYFEQVLHRDKFFMEIPRPKKQSLLPKSLSIQDISKMLAVVENKKHQLLLRLCYGMGLRVSELVHLKITDIDSNRMQVLVHSGKGKKDRYVNLPKSVLKLLREYYQTYKPKDFLFEGQYGGAYSVRSVQIIFKKAMQQARINKQVGIHSLRHSYATHLLEYGTDIALIQQLLGHNDIKTTLIYTEISNRRLQNITSPLDKIS